jgi:hypothetical protein
MERNASAHTRATYSHAFMLLFEFAARHREQSFQPCEVEPTNHDRP